MLKYKISNSKLENPCRTVELPVLQQDIDHLVTEGYLVLKNLFTESEVDVMRYALDQITEVERFYKDPNNPGTYSSGQYIRWLMDKDPAFEILFNCSVPRSVARAVLGPQVRFENVDARIAFAGVPGQVVPWHIHLRVVPVPMPPLFCYPHAIHGLVYLDDVGEEEGPLCVLPGSHRDVAFSLPQNDCEIKPGQVAITISAGTCILMHGNLWHRTLPASAKARLRRLLLFGYVPSWLRTDQTGGVKGEHNYFEKKLAETTDPIIRELLGEFYWS